MGGLVCCGNSDERKNNLNESTILKPYHKNGNNNSNNFEDIDSEDLFEITSDLVAS